MSYINKRNKLFMSGPKKNIVPARSEARMKNYFSTTDARAWSDTVEERRQHILEYTAQNKEGFCLDKCIPLETIFNTMMAGKNFEIQKLREKIECLEKWLNIYSQIQLSPEQKIKLDKLKSEIKKVNGNLDCLEGISGKKVVGTHRRQDIGEYPDEKPEKEDKCNVTTCTKNPSKTTKCKQSNTNAEKSTSQVPCTKLVKMERSHVTDIAFPSPLDIGLMQEAIESKTFRCTKSDEINEIRDIKTEVPCTNTESSECKNKIVDKIDKYVKFPPNLHQGSDQSCDLACSHVSVENELNQYQLQIETLQSQLKEMDTCFRGTNKLTESECASMAYMKREVELTRLENKKLQEIASKITLPAEGVMLQNIVRQFRRVVRRISDELRKQCKEWNRMKYRHKQSEDIFSQVSFSCPNKSKTPKSIKCSEITNNESSIDLEQELDDIYREKEKLKEIVKRIQQEKTECPQKALDSLKLNNANLKHQLQKEIEYRKDLENKLFNIMN